MNSDDPRARRTRACLCSAVLALAAEQDLDDVTLSAVAARAGVNRATIYLHYPDLDALLTEAMEDAITTLARATAVCPLDAPRDRAPGPLVELFEHVADNATRYARMLGARGSARFAARLRERLTEAVRERFDRGDRPEDEPDVPGDLRAAYLAGALTGVIAHWAADVERVPPEQVALATWRLLG